MERTASEEVGIVCYSYKDREAMEEARRMRREEEERRRREEHARKEKGQRAPEKERELVRA